jgi:predicted small metal-binding protein
MSESRIGEPPTAGALTVRCACGWEVQGSEVEVVDATRRHGELVHNMHATREQILAMAITMSPAGPTAHSGDTPT